MTCSPEIGIRDKSYMTHSPGSSIKGQEKYNTDLVPLGHRIRDLNIMAPCHERGVRVPYTYPDFWVPLVAYSHKLSPRSSVRSINISATSPFSCQTPISKAQRKRLPYFY